MSESATPAPVKMEVKKEEAQAPVPEGGAPVAPAGGKGPRRPKGEKTCYNCGEVRRFDCSCHPWRCLSE
jgi:hypothetical protein